jgi:hypothetical protein
MIIGPTIATWHKNELALAAELIDSFVNGVESQAAESIEQYRKGRETRTVVYEFDDQIYGERVEEFRGLNSESWNMGLLFEEHFPSLHRRSALLTVWGYFEHELDKLCFLYKTKKRFMMDLTDIGGKGIDRSTKYLEKVAGLDVHYNSREWQEIKKIREIRNKIAHQDGRLVTKKGTPTSELILYVEQSEFLKKDGDVVVLKDGFLKYVVDTFRAYFERIGESIEEKENAQNVASPRG